MKSITELATAQGVSPSTLTRLATSLGYKGFNAFQNVFRHEFDTHGHFYSDLAKDLLAGDSASQGMHRIMQIVGKEESQNISFMLENLNEKSLNETATLLAKTPHVYIIGFRQAYSISSYFSYALGMIKSGVFVIGSAGHGSVHTLAQVKKKDLLIIIGCSPYSKNCIVVSEIATQQKIPYIALTDSYSSPFAANAKHTFVIPVKGSFYSNNMASYLVFIEGLLSLTLKKMGNKALQALKHREQLISDMDVQY